MMKRVWKILQRLKKLKCPPPRDPQAEEDVADANNSEPEKSPEVVAAQEEPDPVPTGKNGFLADFDHNKNLELKRMTGSSLILKEKL